MKLADLYPGKPALRDKIPQRFWSKVEIRGGDECWPWRAASCAHGKAKLGYGRFGIVSGRIVTAHRAAYLLTHEEVDDALFVCHSCDNPPCCNPKHLFLGSGKDNADDRDAKGRYVLGRRAIGEEHKSAKLTDAQARDAYRRCANGERTKDIAEEFGVSQSLVQKISSGKSRNAARLKLAEIRNREREQGERCGCTIRNGLTYGWCDEHWRENEERQSEMRARALKRNAERVAFSPAQVLSNLNKMGA